MSINVDRIKKLTDKLGVVEEKMGNLQTERDEIAREISSLLGGAPATSTPSYKTASSPKKSSLGDRIVAYLQSNPGVGLQQIAKGLKVAPNQVGLSLFHLTKGDHARAFMDEKENYFASVPLTAAAKTSAAQATDGGNG